MGQRKFSDILIHISELIFKPNFEDAANLSLCKLYKNSIAEYERAIEENVALLEDVPFEERSDSDSDENDSSWHYEDHFVLEFACFIALITFFSSFTYFILRA